jgi:hypothetical protein
MLTAGEQGIEPQLKASKASVLPLDDSPIALNLTKKTQIDHPYPLPF